MQSNAASAKESAAAELTAQAETLKDAVSDVLRLLDGQKARQGPNDRFFPRLILVTAFLGCAVTGSAAAGASAASASPTNGTAQASTSPGPDRALDQALALQ